MKQTLSLQSENRSEISFRREIKVYFSTSLVLLMYSMYTDFISILPVFVYFCNLHVGKIAVFASVF